MLKAVHLLLTYRCDRACDHCFVYGSPDAKGTFTLSQIREVLEDLPRIGTIETVFFEGGEPFLFYPIVLEGIRLARGMGFQASIVTNAYWGTTKDDAQVWLRPLSELGVSGLTLSGDSLHHGEGEDSAAENVVAAAEELGMSASVIRTEKPSVETDAEGQPVITGGVRFRGRAAETLIEGLPTKPYDQFTECPFEDLRNPGRVHLDVYGHVHLCQGLSMGNMWQTPLSEIVKNYDPDAHPICGPLLRGGPALLAKEYGVDHEAEYVGPCHFCYLVRRALLDRFGEYLAPRQVYGLDGARDLTQ